MSDPANGICDGTNHFQLGYPVRMSPTTKPNLAWRCACGWWQFTGADKTWRAPTDDESIRLQWLERLNA